MTHTLDVTDGEGLQLPGDLTQGLLTVARLRCTAVAVGPVQTGPQLAVHLRGAIGWWLRRGHCPEPDTPVCQHCSDSAPCAYRLAFEATTAPDRLGPASRHSDWPKAFWLRAPGLRGMLRPGQPFAFELLAAGAASEALPDAVAALLRVQTAGLGRKHAWFRLALAESLDLQGRVLASIPHQELIRQRMPILPQTLAVPQYLQPTGAPVGLTIRYHSPMSLRHRGERQVVPTLPALLGSLGRRVRHLTEHWGQPLQHISWPEVPMSQVMEVRGGVETVQRVSQSQQTRQSLSGFVGEVDYQADAAHVVPWLRLGQVLQTGADVQFGFGAYEVVRVW